VKKIFIMLLFFSLSHASEKQQLPSESKQDEATSMEGVQSASPSEVAKQKFLQDMKKMMDVPGTAQNIANKAKRRKK
jgi:hypothetical protein